MTRSWLEGEETMELSSMYLILLDVEVAKALTAPVALVMVFCAASWTLSGSLLDLPNLWTLIKSSI